ncbi:MAG: class II aldolase/adducin family protein [Waterburya sp.]
MIDEGYVKYHCHWYNQPSITEEDIVELNQWRSQLYQLGLIGVYPNKIGFGNISRRLAPSQQLIISATQTGGIAELTVQHYTKVIDFDWHKNYVTCQGLSQASSETLTHAAIYVAQPQVNAVIHVHHGQLWRKLLNVVPTTNPNCAYGTPEMAEEIIRLCKQQRTQEQQIIVMSGHEEGILTFGNSLFDAGQTLLNYFEQYKY